MARRALPWSSAMKLSLLGLILLTSLTASAQQQEAQPLSSQIERLAALVEQQQKQIEQLQKSQTELLQEIHAQKSQTPVASVATASVESTVASDPAPAQES